MSDIRARAIAYARQSELKPDDVTMEELIRMVNLVGLRLAIDNMVAAGFEMGYAAAIDDQVPARPLRDPLRRPKSSPGVRVAVLPRRKR